MVESRFSTRPLYLQVRDAFVQKIVLGDWPAGAAIANENALAKEFGISVGTIRKALEIMEEEGVVHRHQGRGTFVSDQSSNEIAIRFSSIKNHHGQRIEGKIIPLSHEIDLPSASEASKLQIADTAKVIRVKRIHTYNQRPFLVETCVLPQDYFPNVSNEIAHYRICVIAQSNRIYLGNAEERVSARVATNDEAKHLMIEIDSPVLVLDRIIYSIDGRPVEWRLGACYLSENYYAALIN